MTSRSFAVRDEDTVEPGERHGFGVRDLDDGERSGDRAELGPVHRIAGPLDQEPAGERGQQVAGSQVEVAPLLGALVDQLAKVLVRNQEPGAKAAVGHEYHPQPRRVLPELVPLRLTTGVVEDVLGREVSSGFEAPVGVGVTDYNYFVQVEAGGRRDVAECQVTGRGCCAHVLKVAPTDDQQTDLPFHRRRDPQLNDNPVIEPGTGGAPSSVLWPSGPHYFQLTGSDGAVAWVRYRVWAADWYVRTLREVAGSDGNYDRFVGVEMALDGALNSLSSAFDAGIALLIEGTEVKLDVAEADKLQVHRYSWNEARDLLKKPTIGTNSNGTPNDNVWRLVLDIDNALDGERSPRPGGWLAQLRRLRNHVAHQDTLARHHNIAGPSTVRAFGGREVDAFTYLATACDQVSDLTDQMMSLAIQLGARQAHPGWERARWFPRPA